MSDTDVLEQPQTGTSISVIVESNPAVVLLDTKSKDDLFNHIRSEIEAFKPDLTTAKGRDAIKSFAFKITRTKTAVDDAGKKLTEEWRTKTNAVNQARNEAKAELSALAESVRKPLTDWEEAEAARISECREVIKWLKSSLNVYMDETADDVRARGKIVFETVLDPDKYGDMLAEAQEAKDATVESLKVSLARLTKEEADRAELARLQQAEQERLAKEEADRVAEAEAKRIADEAAEEERRAAEQAERAEQQRIENERLENERIEQAKRDAADAARIEAERVAQAQRDEEQRQRDAEQAEKDRKAAEALQAERDRVATLERENAAREQAEQKLREETEARQKDQEHRTAIKTAAKEALIATGASNALATKIVLAILAGDIPSVRLEF